MHVRFVVLIADMSLYPLLDGKIDRVHRDKFGLYLRHYRHSTRIYLVPSAAPDQMDAPLTSDMFPTASVVGTRHHAVRAMVLICVVLS